MTTGRINQITILMRGDCWARITKKWNCYLPLSCSLNPPVTSACAVSAEPRFRRNVAFFRMNNHAMGRWYLTMSTCVLSCETTQIDTQYASPARTCTTSHHANSDAEVVSGLLTNCFPRRHHTTKRLRVQYTV